MLYQSRFRTRALWTSGLSFGLARVTAFVATLALPRLVDPHTYGTLELALAIGIFGATVLGMNAHAVATRLHLMEEEPGASTILAGQCFFLAVFGLLAASCAVVAGGDARYVLSTAILGLFALQLWACTSVQIHGLPMLTGWADSIAIFVVTALAASLAVAGMVSIDAFAVMVVLVAMVGAAIAATALYGADRREIRVLTMQVVRIGSPITLYSLSLLSIFASPRIVIAQILSISDVATFSLCLRLAVVLVFPHQMLGATFFVQLYQLEAAMVGRVMALWIVVLAILATVFAIGTRLLSPWLVLGTQVPAEAVASILPAVIVQTVLWILNANLEMFVNRELLSRQAALVLAGLTLVTVAVGLVLHLSGELGLHAVIHLYMALMLASLIAQMRLLARRGFRFGWCYVALPLSGLPLTASFLPMLQ